MDIVEARVGTVLRDRWRVDSLIGVGGMAAVYAATHRNGNRVALKILHPQLSVDSSVRSRFTREGYVANMITHPGIVRVLDDDVTEEGAAFLVMDLLDGETAEARSRRLGGRLPLEDVLLIADGLLDVIAAAHQAGVIHRDIKPENVFITLDRQIKVLDFGIAGIKDGFAHTSALKTASTMGTPAFMPPEQALGRMKEVDALSDVWAIGATMFNLLSGELVHEAETPNEVLILAATALPRSLANPCPNLPPRIVELVDRAICVDKSGRWSSARAMQHALRQAAGETLREPLPTPNPSSRSVLQTSPMAFRPMGGEDPTLTPEEISDHGIRSPSDDWNVKSGVSRAKPVNHRPLPPGGVPPLDTSTLHGMDSMVEQKRGSGKRMLVLTAAASLVVTLLGSIGATVAWQRQARPIVKAAAAAPGLTEPPAVAKATAPPPPPQAAPAEAPTAKAEEPKVSQDFDVPDSPKATPPPRAAGPNVSPPKKSWLDRRK